MAESGSEQSEPKRFARRKFLTAAGAAAAGAVLLSAVKSSGEQGSKNKFNQELTYSSEFNLPSKTRIQLDAEGLPLQAIFPDGKVKKFDFHDVRKIRETAVTNKEPQILDLVRLPKSAFPKESSVQSESGHSFNQTEPEKHPVLKDLPKDTLSDEELKARGVTIIQPEDFKLSIREAAFAPGEQLEEFNKTGKKLTIAFVDTPYIAPESFLDPKYQPISKYFDSTNGRRANITEVRRKEEKKKDQVVENYKSSPTITFINADEAASANAREANILFSKRSRLILDHLTDDELLFLTADQNSSAQPPAGLEWNSNDGKEAIVIVSTTDHYNKISFANFYFNSKGEFKAAEGGLNNDLYYPYHPGYAANTEQSYPNPADFKTNPQANPRNQTSYPWGTQAMGLTLRHELAHRKLEVPDHGIPNFSEYDTDMEAMQHISNAWQKWNNSGLKDDSLYYFVFSSPGGGYILT